jgi:hypothetical protein
MTVTWVAYEDMAAGQVVLEVDATAIRVFSSRSAEARQIHLSQLRVSPSGPDRKGRHQFEFIASANGAARINLHTDGGGAARIQAWLEVVARNQAALPAPLLQGY